MVPRRCWLLRNLPNFPRQGNDAALSFSGNKAFRPVCLASHLELLGQNPSPSASHDMMRFIRLVAFSGQVSGMGLIGSSWGSSML